MNVNYSILSRIRMVIFFGNATVPDTPVALIQDDENYIITDEIVQPTFPGLLRFGIERWRRV